MTRRFTAGFLKRHTTEVAMLHRLFDPAISILSFSFFVVHRAGWSTSNILASFILFLLVVIVFARFDLYRSWRGASPVLEFRKLIAAWLVVLCLLIAVGRVAGVPALLIGNEGSYFFALVTPFCLILGRLAVRLVLRHLRSRGMNLRRVVICGAGALGRRVCDQIRKDSGYGMQILGFFDDRWSEGLKSVEENPVLGTLDHLVEFVRRESVDIIYFALPFRAEMRMRELVMEIRNTPASLYLVPDIFVFELLHTRLLDLNGIPVFSLFETPLSGIDGWAKRLQDILLASFIVVLISPVMLLIALLIKATSKGPVFFIQARYGLNGHEIKVYKFRTMNVLEEGVQMKQVMKNDPRVTKFGAFLRRTSLDELPQFFNVLKGEMSIVGPRPHTESLNKHYSHLIKDYTLRNKVKPGITGWAQINGWRGETDTLEKMQKRVEYDLEYIRNWSVWLDLKIILLTLFRGFRSENAY